MQLISRAEAKARGLERYFTGKPCKHGHVSERHVQGVCVECRKQARTEFGKKLPGDGTNGRAIWDALDELLAKGEMPRRSHALQLAAKTGWNEGNVLVEMTFWKKFHGLSKPRAAQAPATAA